jgi:lipopolysaccharide biosynthesis regulator YciM
LETGRVERGESSSQSFGSALGSFNSWASSTETIKIYPISQKPVESSEIRNYCTNCGARAKKTGWKFCPSCGSKI